MRNLIPLSDFRRDFSRLASANKEAAKQLQVLLEDALFQASHPGSLTGGHGSTARLDILINGLQSMGTFPTNTIKRYIQAHANVSLAKDGERKTFKFKDGAPSVSMPEVSWFDWKGNDNKSAKVDVDILTTMKRLKSNIDRAKKKGGKVEHEELLPYLNQALEAAATKGKKKSTDKPEAKTQEPEAVEDWETV